MPDISWTPSQKSAIEARDRNILVSAAAGSGKTAVLVERILRRVMEDENRTDIDNMLIVTFTNAAAAEMKEKINKRLRGYEAADRDEAKRRRRQINCIEDADICTIDSFCINCVRSFAQELDLAQDFRICDPAEDSMIIEDTAKRIIEDRYAAYDAGFLELTRRYSGRYHDKALLELITGIYGFIQSYAEPLDKLRELLRFYLEPEADMFRSEWAQGLLKEQSLEARRLIGRMLRIDERRVKTAKSPAELFDILLGECDGMAEDGTIGGFGARFRLLLAYCRAEKSSSPEDFIRLRDICMPLLEGCVPKESAQTLEHLYEGIGALAEIASADCMGGREEWDRVWRAAEVLRRSVVKSRKRDVVTSAINAYYAYFFGFSSGELSYVSQCADEVETQHKEVSAMAEQLFDIVSELSVRAEEVKRRRNSYSFQDIEHFAYRMITSKENTEIADYYRNKYTDILIDEYQDTNGLQDAILAGISRGNNIFMVGDLKQSIYAFRGGDPTIFKKKGAEYAPYGEDREAQSVRIDLADNFRSSTSVVDAVNELFGFIMSDSVGDVDYVKKGEYLVCGRERSDSDEVKATYKDKKSEMVVIPFIAKRGERELENGTAIDKISVEARYVARRIREIVDAGELVCADGEIRPVQYRDFTIIASSVKNIVNVYSAALREQGIPLGIPSVGYYDLFEISVVLSFLRVLANRRSDAALVTVMRSPIGSFSDDELALISCADTEAPFFERLMLYAESGADAELAAKAGHFVRMINRFEEYKHYKSAASIIYDIYTETGFYDFAGAMEGGHQAQQNLTLFYERAKRFSENGANGLYSFVRYIEKLREGSDDEAGAALAGESQNAVRMMTIHASKGLEYPIVFAVSCGKEFPPVVSSDGIINREAGIGLRYTDPVLKLKTDTPIYRWVRLCIRRESRSEDVRKLYVALTRARERLICVMSVSASDYSVHRSVMDGLREKGEAMLADTLERKKLAERGIKAEPSVRLENAAGFYEWMISACYAGIEGKRIGARIAGDAECGAWLFDDSVNSREFYMKDVYSIIKSRYSFESLIGLPSKTTVSRIKEANSSVFEARYHTELNPLPSGTVDGAAGAAAASEIGTAYHKVMELSDPLVCCDSAAAGARIEEIAAAGKISSEAAREISPELIAGFFADDTVGKRVREAHKKGLLHRESPFEIAVTPDCYDADVGGYTRRDMMLLQGTIDCWFENGDGSCTVIDYKTDRKSAFMSDDEFARIKAAEYRVQLELYSRAVDKLMGEGAVTEMYLYLFAIGKFVNVKEVSE